MAITPTSHTVNYLFDSQGEYVAFRKKEYVFTPDGRWIGWTPWLDNDVYSSDGEYIGTISFGNRLYRLVQWKHQGEEAGTIEKPVFPGTFPDPQSPGRAPLPPWAKDVNFDFEEDIDFSAIDDIVGVTKKSARVARVKEHGMLDLDFGMLDEDKKPARTSQAALRRSEFIASGENVAQVQNAPAQAAPAPASDNSVLQKEIENLKGVINSQREIIEQQKEVIAMQKRIISQLEKMGEQQKFRERDLGRLSERIDMVAQKSYNFS